MDLRKITVSKAESLRRLANELEELSPEDSKIFICKGAIFVNAEDLFLKLRVFATEIMAMSTLLKLMIKTLIMYSLNMVEQRKISIGHYRG